LEPLKKVKKDTMEMAYQVIALMGHDHHHEAVGQEDDDDVSDPPGAPEEHKFVLQEVSSAVGKVANHSIYAEL